MSSTMYDYVKLDGCFTAQSYKGIPALLNSFVPRQEAVTAQRRDLCASHLIPSNHWPSHLPFSNFCKRCVAQTRSSYGLEEFEKQKQNNEAEDWAFVHKVLA